MIITISFLVFLVNISILKKAMVQMIQTRAQDSKDKAVFGKMFSKPSPEVFAPPKS
jgi:hypothetical protein